MAFSPFGACAFGPVLAITRNGHAVLGTIAEYPEVVSVPCGHRGRAADGSLEFDFTSWARGTAVVESRREGWLYAVEFSDLGGEVIHKICLTEQSDFEAFRAWVELNQSSGIRGFDVCAASWLENSFLLSASGGETLRSKHSRHSSRWPRRANEEFQVIVGNEGAAGRRHDAHDISRDRSGSSSGIRWPEFTFVSRNLRKYSSTIAQSLALKAFDPEGRFVCAVVAADAELDTWNGHLRELAQNFSTDQT